MARKNQGPECRHLPVTSWSVKKNTKKCRESEIDIEDIEVAERLEVRVSCRVNSEVLTILMLIYKNE